MAKSVFFIFQGCMNLIYALSTKILLVTFRVVLIGIETVMFH